MPSIGKSWLALLLLVSACASSNAPANNEPPAAEAGTIDAPPTLIRPAASAEATATASASARALTPEQAERQEALRNASILGIGGATMSVSPTSMSDGPVDTLPGSSSAQASASSPGVGTADGGGLEKEVVRRIVRQNAGRVRTCYEAALKKTPELTGRTSTAFTIGPEGNVVDAKTTGDIADAEMLGCLTKVFKSMSFPKPHGGKDVKVTYPFAFTPNA
jgi:hypothetical protein